MASSDPYRSTLPRGMVVGSEQILAAVHGQTTPSGRHVRRTKLPPQPAVDPVFDRIWAVARAQGLNQKQLADRAGLGHASVSRLLAGANGMTTYTAAELAAAVGYEITALPKRSPLLALVEAAVAWRAALGDSADTWLTGPALDLIRAVDGHAEGGPRRA